MQIRTRCPQCSRTRKKPEQKCLAKNTETGQFYCHHCGYSSAAQPPIELPTELPEKELPPAVIEFFRKRNIPKNVLLRNRIFWDSEKRAIAFPYVRNGLIQNIKYRTLEKQFSQTPKRKKILYGLDDIAGQDTIIIVEGEIDKLSFEAAGFRNCVSVPDGAPAVSTKNYQSKFDYIRNCEKYFEKVKKIILAADSDPPGKKLESELIRRLGPERCYRIVWPEGCKDAGETLVNHSDFMIMSCADNAKPVPVSGIFTVEDIEKDIFSVYEKGFQKGLSTGWHNVDQYYTVARKEITVIHGIPSHGKSSWLDAMCVNLARENDLSFAIFSPENYPLERHASQISKIYIGRQFLSCFGEEHRMTAEQMKKSISWMKQHYFFILPPENELTVDHILRKTKTIIRRHGIDGLVIDPWNELDHSRKPQYSETEYISDCLTKLRRFARQYNIHIWIVAHPTKLQKNKNGKYPVPTPYDISGSGNWRNKSDNCICVWRDLENEEKPVEIRVQKVRFRNIGKIGNTNLYYDLKSGRYST